MSATPLSQRLREATRDLHREAERAGMMPALLRGELARGRYVLLLRNLHPLYAALEGALARHARHPCVAPLRMPGLERTDALRADLDGLHGPQWHRLPLTETMSAYCRHLETAVPSSPARLAAHVYVRYLGDLAGGQLLREIVRRSMGLAGDLGTAFYAFGDAEEVRMLKDRLKQGLDRIPGAEPEHALIVDEARYSFARHIALFEELADADQLSRSLPAA